MVKAILPFWKVIKEVADKDGQDPALIGAIIMQESAGRIYSYRYEPNVKWSYMPETYSKSLHISFDTELAMQHTSWGLMHIMGFKARELGFDGHLPELLLPIAAIQWGAKALSSFSYPNLDDRIASYNRGSPKVENGVYSNQVYVDGVKEFMKRIRNEPELA